MRARYTFDTFIPHEGNRSAFDAARAVACAPDTAPNPLVLCGPNSTGKTHLLRAIENHLRSRNDATKIVSMNADEFTSYLIWALMHDEMDDFHSRFQGAEYFLLDDLHFLFGRESSQELFYSILQTLLEQGSKIIITSSIHLSTLTTLESALTNIPSLLVAKMELPDLDARLTISRTKAKALGLELEDAPLLFICNRSTNARQIEGALRWIRACRDLEFFAPTTANIMKMLLEEWLPSIQKSKD